MASVLEGRHTAEALVSEAGGARSRDNVTVLSGQNLAAGAVLGKIAVAAATPAAVAGNTGTGTVGTVTVAAGAKAGVYTLTFVEPATSLGDFIVEDPDGVNVGNGVVGTAFTGGGLSFTVTDGAPDFAAGDQFTITVAAGSGKFRAIDFASAVGADAAVGVLLEAVDATAADTVGAAVVRDAEVSTDALVWPAGASGGQKTAALAQLKALGIIARG